MSTISQQISFPTNTCICWSEFVWRSVSHIGWKHFLLNPQLIQCKTRSHPRSILRPGDENGKTYNQHCSKCVDPWLHYSPHLLGSWGLANSILIYWTLSSLECWRSSSGVRSRYLMYVRLRYNCINNAQYLYFLWVAFDTGKVWARIGSHP